MRTIRLTPKDKQVLLDNFNDYLNNLRISSNTIHYSSNLTPSLPALEDPIKLYINADAYCKMLLYVRDTKTEIGWHGTVKRTEDGKAYWITDVMVYPQTVTGATVNTDQVEYEKWLETLSDDTFNHLRFQGHSHVNMSVTPSGVDEQYYDNMIQPLPSNDYYIFLIMNKSGETTWRIYDLKNNCIYENADIDVIVLSSGENKIDLLTTTVNEKLQYLTMPTTPTYNYTYRYPTTTNVSTKNATSIPQHKSRYDYWKGYELDMDIAHELEKKGKKK